MDYRDIDAEALATNVLPHDARTRLNNLPTLRNARKALRNNGTLAESRLWALLKNKQLEGRKFRRQHSLGYYILDFYCASEKLGVELDGDIHLMDSQLSYDEARDAQLQQLGIVVIRIKNEDVFQNHEGVLMRIKDLFSRNRTEPPRPAGTPP